MAYRTYKNLFRVRAEITSIGTGARRLVLPEWCVITVDVVVMTLIALPFMSLIVAPLPNLFVVKVLGFSNPWFVWIEGFAMSFALALYLRKKEAAGKTPLQFIGTIIGFVAKTSSNSYHDGWTGRKINLATSKKNQIFLYRYDDRSCGSLPATGRGIKKFTLVGSVAVKVRGGDRVDFSRKGDRLPPGDYEIVDKKIVPIPTTGSRRPPSIRGEDEN